MNIDLLKKEKGFSYAEVLVAIVILGLIFNGAFFIYERGIFFWNKGDRDIEVQQNLRISMELITKDLRRAIPTSVGIINANGTTVTRAQGKLEVNDSITLKFRKKDGTNFLEETVTYKKAPGRLLRNGQPIAEYITEVYFQYDASKKLATLRLEGEFQGTKKDMQSQTYLRVN